MSEQVMEENYLSILMKGGWILLPIFILLFIAVYIIIERSMVIRDNLKDDRMWISHIKELIAENKPEKAQAICSKINNSSSKVVAAGLLEISNGKKEVEEAMQIESRQQIISLEQGMSHLGIIATIAPMLGFLGTIFGVITIFYNISITNDISIGSISDGLYQKMICSGVGLFVGIIAYSGFYILNSKIDQTVSLIEKDSNDILKSIRSLYKEA
jgi:biopolymer transport protein ExbB